MNLSTVSKKAGHRLFLDLNALTVLSLRLPDNHSPDSRKPGLFAGSRAITGVRFELSLPRRNDCHFKISARPPSRGTSTKLKRGPRFRIRLPSSVESSANLTPTRERDQHLR